VSEAPTSLGSGPKIFVSYRRSDCAGHAGRLYDQLCERFGERQVFMDIDAIRPGEDFTRVLTDAINSSNVFLAIIGRRWLSGTHETASRVDDPNDFVRFEIGAALKAKILIVPVLMEKAAMPRAEDLPADLVDFTRRNAIEVSDARFRDDVKRLVEVIESIVPAAAGARIGPYRLISKLGRGAFGVVWLAEKQTALATTKVALKTPNEEDVDLEAVKAEAEIWIAAGGHRNIHPIIDADIYDGRMAIVSEYAADGSLHQWLQLNGGNASSIETAIRMTDGILAGLEHLHGRNILHRDLKPDNILLQGDNPRLADFGIARMLKDLKSKTLTGGSPWYLAPEAFHGKRSVQTDVWAVGVLLYQLASGRLPFPQEEPASVMHAITTQPFTPLPPSVPAPVREVVAKALEKDANLRFASANEMRKALQAAARSVMSTDDILTAVPHPPAKRTLPSAQRDTTLYATAAPYSNAEELRLRQSKSIRLVVSEIAKYVSNFIGVLSSPKAFLRGRNRGIDQPLLRAVAFWVVSVSLALVCVSALSPPGESVSAFLVKQTVVGVIVLFAYVAVLRLAWRCVGGKASFLTLFVPFAYLQGVAHVLGGIVRLVALGIAKAFDPQLALLIVGKSDPSVADPLDAHLAKAWTSFQTGHRTPLIIAALALGLPVLAFLLSYVWLIIGWGAFRELNGMSRRRSFFAFIISVVIDLLTLPILALIGIATIA
jgi:serine/threonine protein kinase